MNFFVIFTGILGIIVSFFIWRIFKIHIEPYIGTDKRQRYFAEFFKGSVSLHNEKVGDVKKQLFKELQKLESRNPNLKKDSIRILEIGAGSGANLSFYPENCCLVVVEPNPYAEKNFMEHLKKYPGIQLEKFIIGKAEKLNELDDNSFDAVVSTIVCCSVDSEQKTYSEIKRVLSLGGKYFYVEHIQGEQGTWLSWVQKFVDFFEIWPFLFDGCHASRQQDQEIKKYGFSNIEQNAFYIDTSGYWGWNVIQRHVSGIATK